MSFEEMGFKTSIPQDARQKLLGRKNLCVISTDLPQMKKVWIEIWLKDEILHEGNKVKTEQIHTTDLQTESQKHLWYRIPWSTTGLQGIRHLTVMDYLWCWGNSHRVHHKNWYLSAYYDIDGIVRLKDTYKTVGTRGVCSPHPISWLYNNIFYSIVWS